ncbi:MAG: type II toxin-antitoxin system PemK/MazF family toxin [Rhodoferax sp.]|nr:type II toxin-antitoxin system PemK/MazF family toxin [Rhodoferax sp.]
MSASKKRPVLLLTDTNARGDFIAMALTSKSQTNNAVAIAGGPLPLGGALITDSWVRTDKVITLRQTVVAKIMGRVDAPTRQQCVQQLCHALNSVA